MIAWTRWILIFATLLAGTAFAGAREDLDGFTKGLKGLDGRFVQQVFDANGKLKETSSGRVALSAPRLFRWEYVKPYPQLIVADGRKVWVYDPDLQQVTVRPQGVEEENSPLAALIDPARLDRDFNVRELASKEAGLAWLELTPKQPADASFQSARLGFDKAGLARMQVVDALGQRTQISFKGWKKNPGFARSTFRYAPPKGVDVVGEG
ncbi:outer membrane lipoprotein chaperone LolA [Luteimonas vadosa]|uniref:Outer-membrane lipoprotein carrier protein n=1 Tax=Luteimonas vadosa TaxID=1165507 RepID=A0ABP9E3T3_9GAMM